MTRRRWCKHYSGMHETNVCDVGIRFDSLPNHGTKEFMDTCPCFGPSSGCASAQYPTDEELEQQQKDMDARLAKIMLARITIVEHLGGPWKRGLAGASGLIDCPACGEQQTLKFSRSGYNGHIHAACITDGCVRWME